MLFVAQTEKKNVLALTNVNSKGVSAGSQPLFWCSNIYRISIHFFQPFLPIAKFIITWSFFCLYNWILYHTFLLRKPRVFSLSSGRKIVVEMKWTASDETCLFERPTICLLHRFLLWMLWLMHVRRFTGLISTTPRLILRLETVLAMFMCFMYHISFTYFGKRVCSTRFAFRFNFCRYLHVFFMTWLCAL